MSHEVTYIFFYFFKRHFLCYWNDYVFERKVLYYKLIFIFITHTFFPITHVKISLKKSFYFVQNKASVIFCDISQSALLQSNYCNHHVWKLIKTNHVTFMNTFHCISVSNGNKGTAMVRTSIHSRFRIIPYWK